MNRRTFLKTIGILSIATAFLDIEKLFATPITISACIITKNEEKHIKGCLESLKDIVDEIIIVDLKSTDNTVKIAKSFGAKIFNHIWESNISTHRNQAIKYATGGWVFVINADEKLVLSGVIDINKLKTEFHVLLKECDAITIHNQYYGVYHNTTRFFKREIVQYYGIVHPQPKLVKGHQKVIYYQNIYLTSQI